MAVLTSLLTTDRAGNGKRGSLNDTQNLHLGQLFNWEKNEPTLIKANQQRGLMILWAILMTSARNQQFYQFQHAFIIRMKVDFHYVRVRGVRWLGQRGLQSCITAETQIRPRWLSWRLTVLQGISSNLLSFSRSTLFLQFLRGIWRSCFRTFWKRMNGLKRCLMGG